MADRWGSKHPENDPLALAVAEAAARERERQDRLRELEEKMQRGEK